MGALTMSSRDEITMRLVHYFVTKENYQPIVVNGLDNEIWLENTDKKYEVIRINSNYIHNNDQLEFDNFKAKSVIKQIKKKTFSFNCEALSILLNVGDNVNFDKAKDEKHIEVCTINDVNDLDKENKLLELFPGIKEDKVDGVDDIDFFINVTHDINKKTEEKNKLYEKTFKKKSIVVTYVLIVINVIVFLFNNVLGLSINGTNIGNYLAMSGSGIQHFEFWRLITSAFVHADIVHIACNMYALYILGKQVETTMGKLKFSLVYFISAITCSLLSGALLSVNTLSVGASGAIFGLMGCLLYFGYHYRLYFGNVIIQQIVPVIVLNLALSLMIPNISLVGHLGGLVGGIFASMIVGVEGKTNKRDMINGIIVTVILAVFLMYMIMNKAV